MKYAYVDMQSVIVQELSSLCALHAVLLEVIVRALLGNIVCALLNIDVSFLENVFIRLGKRGKQHIW